jgi:hypothetical protein
MAKQAAGSENEAPAHNFNENDDLVIFTRHLEGRSEGFRLWMARMLPKTSQPVPGAKPSGPQPT